MIRARVVGVPLVVSTFARIGVEMRERLKLEVRQTGASVKRDARARAPVGKTGNLRRGIRRRSRRKGLLAVIRATAPYSAYVEFGSYEYRRRKPKPFLLPARREELPGFRRRVRKIVGQTVRSARSRGG